MSKIYRYKARNQKGELKVGKLRGETKEEIAVVIQSKNLLIVEIKKEKLIFPFLNQDLMWRFRSVKLSEFSRFCRQFFIILSAGVPITQALEILKDQTQDKGLAKDCIGVCNDIRSGTDLSKTMEKYPKSFPKLFVSMIHIGEISGNLIEIIAEVANYYENEEKNRQRIKQLMFYPIILICVAVGVVVFLLINVLPTFIGMFETMEISLPKITQLLLNISQGLKEKGFVGLLGIIGLILCLCLLFEIPRIKLLKDYITMKMPLFSGLNHKRFLGQFSKILGLLLESGIDLLAALNYMERMFDNYYVEKEMNIIENKIAKGFKLSIAMEESSLFPSLFCQLMAVGETSGSLPEVLKKITLIYEDDVKNSVAMLETALEPVILIVLGGMVFLILAAIMLPIFDLYSVYSEM
jgi:type IV pilus assembly protein PilC